MTDQKRGELHREQLRGKEEQEKDGHLLIQVARQPVHVLKEKGECLDNLFSSTAARMFPHAVSRRASHQAVLV
jgi:hypothetical protein